MIARSIGRHLRICPSRVRQVIDFIRGRGVQESQVFLTHINKRSRHVVKNVLNSAVSNAKQKGFTEDQLFVSKVTADQGASWRRYKAAAFGRATPIDRKTTHLTIELDLKK